MVATVDLTLMAYNRNNVATCYATVDPAPLVYICKICKTVMRGRGAGKLCRPCQDLHNKGLSGKVELREVDMNDDKIRAGIRKYRVEWEKDPTSIQVANTHILNMLYRNQTAPRLLDNRTLYGIPVVYNNKVPSTKVWMI